MSSITGLKKGSFTSVDNSGEFRLGTTLDSGTTGECITSNGVNQPTSWGTPVGHIANPLTAGTNVNFTSGNPSYDGSVAETINSVNQPLTAGTNVNFSSGNPTFDGSVADTINSVDTDTIYYAGSGIELLGVPPVNIWTKNDLTTINNLGAGNTNQVLKVPNALTSGTNVSFSAGTTYDGSAAITINSTDTDTTYQGGDNITIDTLTNPDTINLDKTLLDMTSIFFNGTGTPTYIQGSNYYMGTGTPCYYLDLTSPSNHITPPNVFEYAGDLRMTIDMGGFLPNDDSSYYNIGVEDDLSANIHGTIRPLTSSLEACGYFTIPANYTATAVRIDINNSAGVSLGRTITCESITTYGAMGFTSLGTITAGSEQALTTTMPAASDKQMLIKIYTTSTTDHIRGGYIKLTRN